MSCNLAGIDEFGNKYYSAKNQDTGKNQKRYVIYNNHNNAEPVPANWHSWLHHMTDQVQLITKKPQKTSYTQVNVALKDSGKELYHIWQPKD